MLSNFAIPKRPAGHKPNCACNDCLASDFAAFSVERGGDLSGLNVEYLVGHVRRERAKPLNWSLSEQHCILCGGTSFVSSEIAEHYQIRRHNEKESQGLFYSSWLIWPTAWPAATLFEALERKWPKETLLKWVSVNMDLNPAHARAIGIRESDPWIELRVGYTNLEHMDRERRIREGVTIRI